ncbi:helix-turn-helix domain-containing protein [Streptomyces sp. NPDC052013]|uniref:PucR family transcriptional regulator n=1 Tax=Streptomyces sp. NPDC052013 TaxID=3365679 RepID=UPI0037D20B37
MPDPAVPPTPPVPLEALLAREDLGLRRIAGPTDPGIVIHWAHTSEMADPYPYLLGGELLLTAGVHIPDGAGTGYFDAYVSRIVAAGGAALGFGLAPLHDTVPGALVESCDLHGLPLLEVPPRTTFSGVARAVWQLMARARVAELRRVTEAQQSLATAASRPDPIPSVLRQLATRLSGYAVLYGPESTELASAGREQSPEVRAGLASLAEVVRPAVWSDMAAGGRAAAAARVGDGGPPARAKPRVGEAPGERGQAAPPPPSPHPASATDTLVDTHLAAYALGAENGFVLAVATPHRESTDHTIASVAAVLLSLLTGEHQSATGAARSSALVRVLLGSDPQDVAPLLGDDRWRVVHAAPATQAAPDSLAASALGAALGSALVDLTDDVVRVLVPGDRQPDALPGWTLGVSAPAAPSDWPAADTQAARALARARATRAPLVRHGDRPAVTDLIPAPDADAHARALLAPLGGNPALTDTLRTWLSLHGSWDRTAVALSVHRNTVRQRIARCATLLDADLDDPDVRMELWFALRRA